MKGKRTDFRPVWLRSKRWEKAAEEYAAFGASEWTGAVVKSLADLLAQPEWAGSELQGPFGRFGDGTRPYVRVVHPRGATATIYVDAGVGL